MKNLKKVLALGLALVMILGMFTIASAAETKKSALDFTDWDKVEHKDAVALCVDLGIINGLPDGSFAPDQTIDRASWAKLVYFTKTGDDNADAYLGANSALKDVKGSWAESYINYLVANKYVSGDNLGNYNPTGTVTVAAGLKTMLTVLGYDAEEEGYQNDDAWMGNIITDAKRFGLMADIDRKNTATVNLTRDNAAQIVYNTLMAETVEPVWGRDNGVKYVSDYKNTGTLGNNVFDIVKVNATIGSVNGSGEATFSAVEANAAHAVTAAELNAKKVKASSTLVGEKVTLFVTLKSDKGLDKVVSTNVVKAASSATKTITDGVALADITTENKTSDATKAHYVGEAYKVNGVETITYVMNGDSSKVASDLTTDASKAGNVVEVYTNGDGQVNMIKLTTYTTETVGADAVQTKTDKEGKVSIKVDGVTGLSTNWVAADDVTGYQGLVEGDVVLLNKDSNNKYTIEKAEKITGKVTNRKSSTITVNGETYDESGIKDATVTFATTFSDLSKTKDNEYDFWLDKNGTVCATKLVSGEVTTEVAYVLRVADVAGSGGLNGSSAYLEAELLFDDATTEIVKVAKVNDEKVVDGTAGTDETTVSEAKTALEAMTFVDYSVDSKGNYEIKTKIGTKVVANNETIATDATVQIKSAPAYVDQSSNHVGDSKTMFLVKKGTGDDAQFFAYTGVKNVPAMKAKVVEAIKINDSADSRNGTDTYVYLEADLFDSDKPDGLVYVKKADDGSQNTDGKYVVSVVDANGNADATIVMNADATATGLFAVTSVDEKGVTTLAAAATTTDTLTSIGNGNININGTITTYDKDTVCVVIDLANGGAFESAGNFNPDNFKVNASEYESVNAVAVANDGVCSFLYVVRTANAG